MNRIKTSRNLTKKYKILWIRICRQNC